MALEIGETPTPEERTAELFNLSSQQLSERLKPSEEEGMIIALNSSDRKIRVALVEPYSQVGEFYEAIRKLKPGTLWNPARRAIAQSLIVTPSEGEDGSCVRLLKVDFFDPKTGEFVKECDIEGEHFGPTEGYIAKYLQLEKGDISDLKFTDNTEVLRI